MDKISTFNIGVTLDTLRGSFQRGDIPDNLHRPMHALLKRLTHLAVNEPVSVYLFSSERDAELRHFFGYALAKALLKHIPSTLLVDCEFLEIGMSGVVPQKDALGFLDLVLYGSSLGVITQETAGGVHVVGAGSFPVTKRMPFILSAFEEAQRRLVHHARCAIFSGPLYEDEGEIHSLVGAVDVPVLFRAVEGVGATVVDPIEEQIVSRWNKELLSVRVTEVEEKQTAVERPAAKEPEGIGVGTPPVAPVDIDEEKTIASLDEMLSTEPPPLRGPSTPAPGEPPARPAPEKETKTEKTYVPEWAEESVAPTRKRRRQGSMFSRIATWVIGIIIVVLVVWWVRQGGEQGEGVTAQQGNDEVTVVENDGATSSPESETDAGQGSQPADTTAVDAVAAQPDAETTPPPLAEEVTTSESPAVEEEKPTGDSTPVATAEELIESDDILILADLENEWDGYYVVHISSFKTSASARKEVAYLKGKGFPVFIVYLDLGAKGNWYRVYAGPLKTRDDARSMKKNLDDTPGVRFTAITRM